MKLLASLADNPDYLRGWWYATTVIGESNGVSLSHQPSARAAHSELVEAWNGRAMALDDLGHSAAAAGAYLKVAELDPIMARATLDAIRLLCQDGQLDQARAIAERLTVERPDLSVSHLHLGTVCAMQGDLQQAVVAYRKSLDLYPASPDCRANLAQALLLSGDALAAVDELRTDHRLAPEHDAVARQFVWVLAAHPDAMVRAPAEAVQVAETAMADSHRADDARWLDVHSVALAAQGDYSAAQATAVRGELAARRLGAIELANAIAHRRQLFESRQSFIDATLKPAE